MKYVSSLLIAFAFIMVWPKWGRPQLTTGVSEIWGSGKYDVDISQVWAFYSISGVREIWSLDNQFYGYVFYRQRELVSAKVVDEYTVRLIHNYGVYEEGP